MHDDTVNMIKILQDEILALEAERREIDFLIAEAQQSIDQLNTPISFEIFNSHQYFDLFQSEEQCIYIINTTGRIYGGSSCI